LKFYAEKQAVNRPEKNFNRKGEKGAQRKVFSAFSFFVSPSSPLR
jgi:hypothetical protein